MPDFFDSEERLFANLILQADNADYCCSRCKQCNKDEISRKAFPNVITEAF